MSRIQIDLSAVRSANYNVPNISSKVNNTKRSVGILKWRIPDEIAGRYNIRQRMEKVYTDIDQLENKINALHDITSSCVLQYESVENENNRNADMFI